MTVNLFLRIALLCLLSASEMAFAAKDNNAKAIKKLQLMVQEMSTERERLSAENTKLLAEIDEVKKMTELESKSKKELEAKNKLLNLDLSNQKSQTEDLRKRLGDATTRIQEIIDKYNALNQSKNVLFTEHEKLKNTHQFTTSELHRSEQNNLKLYENSKHLVKGFEQCKSRGIVEKLLDSEPLFQFNKVEYEAIAQEYEDKIRKQVFIKSESKPK